MGYGFGDFFIFFNAFGRIRTDPADWPGRYFIAKKEVAQPGGPILMCILSMAEVTKDIIIKKLRQLSNLNNLLNKRSNIISIDSLALCLHIKTNTLISLLELLENEGKISYIRAVPVSNSYTIKYNHGQVCLL